jgi:hypothetical protein
MAADGRMILGSPFPLMGKGRDRGVSETDKAITPTFVFPVEGKENRLEGALIIKLSFGFDYLFQCRQRS